MKKLLIALLVMTVTFIAVKSFGTTAGMKDFDKKGLYTSEKVQIKKTHEEAWQVWGMIRNNSTRPVSGMVNIQFVNSHGDITYTTKARVADGAKIQPNQAAAFDSYTEPSNFDDVVDFNVEFRER